MKMNDCSFKCGNFPCKEKTNRKKRCIFFIKLFLEKNSTFFHINSCCYRISPYTISISYDFLCLHSTYFHSYKLFLYCHAQAVIWQIHLPPPKSKEPAICGYVWRARDSNKHIEIRRKINTHAATLSQPTCVQVDRNKSLRPKRCETERNEEWLARVEHLFPHLCLIQVTLQSSFHHINHTDA